MYKRERELHIIDSKANPFPVTLLVMNFIGFEVMTFRAVAYCQPLLITATALIKRKSHHTQVVKNSGNLLLEIHVRDFSGLLLHLLHLVVGHVQVGLQVPRHHDESEHEDGDHQVQPGRFELF